MDDELFLQKVESARHKHQEDHVADHQDDAAIGLEVLHVGLEVRLTVLGGGRVVLLAENLFFVGFVFILILGLVQVRILSEL